MSEQNTYEAGSEKVENVDVAMDRQPFAFEGGAECYSDQLRRIGEGGLGQDPAEAASQNIGKGGRNWTSPIGQTAEETSEDAPAEPSHNQSIGKRGEDAAARFLERRGYEILARNWSCIHGEADIIARDDAAIVFVEVKTRTNCDHGMPEEAVTPAKRNRYERIAGAFLKEYPCSEAPIRFDVVGLMVIAPDRAMIKHHINAFAID